VVDITRSSQLHDATNVAAQVFYDSVPMNFLLMICSCPASLSAAFCLECQQNHISMQRVALLRDTSACGKCCCPGAVVCGDLS